MMIRDLLDKMPGWPTLAIAGYLFLKPFLPGSILGENLKKGLDGGPVSNVEYLLFAVHLFMGLVFFARLGRMLEVWLIGAKVDDEAEPKSDEPPQGKDVDA